MRICWDKLNCVVYTKNKTFAIKRNKTSYIPLVYVEACKNCGEPFLAVKQQIKRGGGQFCGNSCANKQEYNPMHGRIGRDCPNTGKHRPDISRRMRGEGNPMWQIGKKHPMYKKRGKLSHAYKEKNVNWKGGITPLNEKLRKDAKYKWWRKGVFERDDYTCQKCGKRGGNLNAHHILPWERHPYKRFDVNNGMTLCIECHRWTHSSQNSKHRYIRELV